MGWQGRRGIKGLGEGLGRKQTSKEPRIALGLNLNQVRNSETRLISLVPVCMPACPLRSLSFQAKSLG